MNCQAIAERGIAVQSDAERRVAERSVALGRSSIIGFRWWNGGGAGLIVTGGRWVCSAVRCKAQLSVAPRGGAMPSNAQLRLMNCSTKRMKWEF